MGKYSSNAATFCSNSKKCYKKNKTSSYNDAQNNSVASIQKRRRSSCRNAVIKKSIILREENFVIMKITGRKFDSIVINFYADKISENNFSAIRQYAIGNNCNVAYVNFNAGVNNISDKDINKLANSIINDFSRVYVFDAKTREGRRCIKIVKRKKL